MRQRSWNRSFRTFTSGSCAGPVVRVVATDLLAQLACAHDDDVVVDVVAAPDLRRHAIEQAAERIVLLAEQAVIGFLLVVRRRGGPRSALQASERVEEAGEAVEQRIVSRRILARVTRSAPCPSKQSRGPALQEGGALVGGEQRPVTQDVRRRQLQQQRWLVRHPLFLHQQQSGVLALAMHEEQRCLRKQSATRFATLRRQPASTCAKEAPGSAPISMPAPRCEVAATPPARSQNASAPIDPSGSGGSDAFRRTRPSLVFLSHLELRRAPTHPRIARTRARRGGTSRPGTRSRRSRRVWCAADVRFAEPTKQISRFGFCVKKR